MRDNLKPSPEELEKLARKVEKMARKSPRRGLEEIREKSSPIKGSCKVCGGKIVEDFVPVYDPNPIIGGRCPTERILYCKDCGVIYHHLPEKKIRKKQ